MKYYSEELKELFDTPEELEEAEAAANKTEEALKADVDRETNNFEMARERAKELRKEADTMVDEAREKYFEALRKYNKKVGPLIEVTKNDYEKSYKDLIEDLFSSLNFKFPLDK